MVAVSQFTISKINDGAPGATGQTGPQGVSIIKAEQEYRLSNSSTQLTGSGEGYTWSTTKPTIGANQYLWNRQRNYLSDNTSSYSDAVCDMVITNVSFDVDQLNTAITTKVSQSDIDSSISAYDGNTVSTIRDRVTTTENSLSGITSRVSDVETTLTGNPNDPDDGGLVERMTSAESAITQNADNINSKVSANGVISAINQSSESITIDAERVNINGAVTFQGRVVATKVYTATSSTGATTATKDAATLTGSGYALVVGTTVTVTFSNASTADAPKLRIDSSASGDAKSIYVNGAVASSTNRFRWQAGSIITFQYDGQYWKVIGYENITSFTSSTGASTQAKTASGTGTFVLCNGSTVDVYFSTANTYVSNKITLNVGSTGAYDVWYKNAVTSSSNKLTWSAGMTLNFTFVVTSSASYWRVNDDGALLANENASSAVSTASTASTNASNALSAVNASIKSTTMHYLATSASSGVTRSTSGWSTTVQSISATNRYLWTYQTITKVDNSTSDTDPVISGVWGNTGSDGTSVTVSSSVTTYQAGTSGTQQPTGTWQSSIPSVNDGEYLWTRVVTTFSDNSTATSYSVAKQGQQGQQGASGTSVTVTSSSTTYQSGTSGTSEPTGTWSATIPTVAQGNYLWTKTVVQYSDGNSTTSYAVSYQSEDGTPGAAGLGVKSVEQLYITQATTSTPNKPQTKVTSVLTTANQWTLAMPTYDSGNPYYFTCTQTTYSDDTWDCSAVARSKALEDANTTANTASTNASAAVSTANTASTNATSALNGIKAYMGTCSTAVGTAQKDVTCSDSSFALVNGVTIKVTFSNASTANALKLKVNSTDAKNIYYNGAAASDVNRFRWQAGSVVTFQYNGTGWVVLSYENATALTSSTGATTQTKTVTPTGTFVLTNGTTVDVYFSNANTYTSQVLKLDIGSTGAFNVWYKGQATSSTNPLTWSAGITLRFTFVVVSSSSQYWLINDGSVLTVVDWVDTNGTGVVSAKDIVDSWKTTALDGTTTINGGLIETGTIVSDGIAANAIIAGKIASGAVTTAKLDAGAVTTAKLDTNAIKSTNYSPPTTGASGTTPYSVSGTFLDLSNGNFTSQNFAINSGNAYLTGVINAMSGNIGGWVIGQNELYSEYGEYGDLFDYYKVYMRTYDENTTLANTKLIGVSTTLSDPFYVTGAGKLYAQNAEINGIINSVSGSIGGWEISEKELSSGITINNVDYSVFLRKYDDGTILATTSGYQTTVSYTGNGVFQITPSRNGSGSISFSYNITNYPTKKLHIWSSYHTDKNAEVLPELENNGVTWMTVSESVVLNPQTGEQTIDIDNYDFTGGTLTVTIPFNNMSLSDGTYTLRFEISDYDDVQYQIVANATVNESSLDVGVIGISRKESGVTTMPFYVTRRGELYASDANIVGSITADSGTIAGFTIANEDTDTCKAKTTAQGGHRYGVSLYKHSTGTVDGVSYEYESGMKGTGTGTEVAFYVSQLASGGIWSDNSLNFYVRHNGFLYAKDANITGTITASGGSIGGFKITKQDTGCAAKTSANGGHTYVTSLYTHNSDTTYEYETGIKGESSTSTADTFAFYITRITKGGTWQSASDGGTRVNPFYIKNNGYMYASNASISGTINAKVFTARYNGTSSNALVELNADGLFIQSSSYQNNLRPQGFYIWDLSTGSGSVYSKMLQATPALGYETYSGNAYGSMYANSVDVSYEYDPGETGTSRHGRFTASAAGNVGLYDVANSEWIIQSNASYNVNIPHPLTVSSLTVGSASGNNVSVEALTVNVYNNTSKRTVRITSSDAGNIGLYDVDEGTFIIASNSSKEIGTSNQFFCYGRKTTDTTRRVPVFSSNTSNQMMLWFGGTATSTLSIHGQWNSSTWATKTVAVSSSDIRLKKDIKDSEVDALAVINRVKVRDFVWKDDGVHQKVGVVVDELEELDPLLSVGGGEDEDGNPIYKSVNNLLMIAYLTKSVQQLSAKVERLEDEIKILRR